MKHEPNGREVNKTAREGTREPVNKIAREGTREPVNKIAKEGTREPGNKEEQSQQQVKFTTQHVEKNGTQCFKSGSNDKWDNKFDQDESNVINKHRPEGKLSQSEAENFRDEDETDQSRIETVWFG